MSETEVKPDVSGARMNRGTYWPLIIVVEAFIGLFSWGTGASSTFMSILSWCLLVMFELGAICASVERLHDTDRSGWNYLWVLLPIAGPIVLIVFLCQKGTEGPNRFGPPAK